MEGDHIYITKIKDAILKYNPGIGIIDDFEFGRILPYNESNLNAVKNALERKQFSLIAEISVSDQSTGDDLLLVEFSAGENKRYVAMLYDSDDLWQDPEVLAIYDK
jgi:hypothetical protein